MIIEIEMKIVLKIPLYISRGLKITIIMLEKQALQGIFENVISNMCILVTTRGQSSFTQLYELSQILKDDTREKYLYIFSDIPISDKFDNKEFEDSWYRCEIYTEEDKELLCFTNPISITPLLRKQ